MGLKSITVYRDVAAKLHFCESRSSRCSGYWVDLVRGWGRPLKTPAGSPFHSDLSLLLDLRIFLKTNRVVLSCLPAGRSVKAADSCKADFGVPISE